MINLEKVGDLTIFRISEEVTANELITKAAQYMEGEQTKTSMWDFTQTTKIDISTLELKGIADSLKRAAGDDAVGKVALVGSKSINIGLGKVFAAFAQMARLPYTYKSFRNIDQALQWLEE